MILEDTAITKLKDILAEENNPNIKLRVLTLNTIQLKC